MYALGVSKLPIIMNKCLNYSSEIYQNISLYMIYIYTRYIMTIKCDIKTCKSMSADLEFVT